MNNWRLGVALLACWGATAAAAAPRMAIEPVEKWSDVFADAEVKLHYAVRTSQPAEGRLAWSLSVNRRTLDRGETPLRGTPQQAAEVVLPLRIPAVKEGIALQAELGVAAYAGDGKQPAATHSKSVWIFAPDPFVDRKEWLRSLGITLFDPPGKTTELFEKAHIPFKLTRNTDALPELEKGLLVIGEGTAWRDYRSLGQAMVKAAARGVPVLCLAPGEGAIALPGAEDQDLPAPSAVVLRREDVIQDLDKRLDSVAWPPMGEISISRLAITGDRQRVMVEVVDAGRREEPARGWPWLEARYGASRGRLIVCGFGIIRYWEAGPAPRYLLAELLARLTAQKPSTPSPEERNDP